MRSRVVVIGVAALALLLCFGGGHGPADRAPAPHATAAPAAIDADWWAAVQKDLSRAEYSVTWQEKTCLRGLECAYHAPNRAQDLRTYFTPDGFRMTSRTHADAGWEWGLRLAAYGFAGTLRAPAAATLAPRDNRIEYQRGDLVEWYVNDERGLEQGFTLAAPPPGAAAGGARLVFDLALTGNISAALRQDGTGLAIRTRDGAHVVDYTQLVAYDATGRDLPAAMLLADGGASLRLEVDAAGARYPVTVDPLSTSPSWSEYGNQAGEALGTSVCAAGDVNGDGFGDFIFGAPYYDDGQVDEGMAAVYLGAALGFYESPSWYVTSDRANARFGFSVSTAGDVNGDGYSDIIVGAPGYDIYASEGGGVFVWHGSPEGLPAGHALATAAWTTQSDHAGDRLGFAVGTAGDVNGDGYSDITYGAPYQTVAGVTETGSMYVHLGSATGVLTARTGIYLNQAGAHSGWSVGSAGDFNGDGYGDVFLSAPDWDVTTPSNNRGRVCIAYGPDLSLATLWYKEGAADQGQFGYSVSTAGDVNGDGYGDVIIGSPGYANGQTAEGAAFVFLGGAAPSTTPAWTAESDQAEAHLGKAVATAGDVDGDGYGDIVVGAPEYDNGQTDEGVGLAWFGSATGLGANGTPANADWRREGDATDARFASSVFLAGDVNGDGYSDVIVGAPNLTAGAGAARVYLGARSGLSPLNPYMAGSQASALLGWSVASAGDVDGDGYSDLIVAAPYYDNGETNEGMVWVYHGAASFDLTTAEWSAQGDQASARFGHSVGRAGDVNGDGYDDIIVGAPYYDNGQTDEGRVFVWLGSATGLGAAGTPANADWSAESNQASAIFGYSVGGAGDVNGDGFADVIVGAPTYDNAYTDEGEIFVWYGSASGLGTSGTPLNVDWFAESVQASAQLGLSAGTAGDVDGDGYSDVITGAPYYDGMLTNEGGAFVWRGSATGLVPEATPRNADWMATGGRASAEFGLSVGTAGDVNGDGYSDIIVGAPYYANGETGEGAAYLYLGSGTGIATTAVFQQESNQANAHMGFAVGTAGDTNGDGYADFFYTAPDFDNGETNEGLVWIRYGQAAGLSNPPTSTAESNSATARFGMSAACAGDLNGDGFADFVVGAPYFDSVDLDKGAVYYKLGGGGAGNRTPLPRQIYVHSATPIARLGQSDEPDGFRMQVRATTPFGRGRVGLETEVKPTGQPFDGAGGDFAPGMSVDSGLSGFTFGRYRGGLISGRTYHWRARVRYSPAACPFQAAGRWLTIPWGGWNEALVRINTSLVDVPEGPATGAIGVSLAPPAPNPFGGATTLRFTLPAATAATLRVYDVSGRLVRELLDAPRAEAGAHTLTWDGRDDAGRRVGPGVYFARLATPLGESKTRLVLTGE